MKTIIKIVILAVIVGGFVFARTVQVSPRGIEKDRAVKSEHYWVKDHASDKNDQLDRKRSHKRRRKVRKPVKGLR